MIPLFELFLVLFDYFYFLLEPFAERFAKKFNINYNSTIYQCQNQFYEKPLWLTKKRIEFNKNNLNHEINLFYEYKKKCEHFKKQYSQTWKEKSFIIEKLKEKILLKWPWLTFIHLAPLDPIDGRFNWLNYDICLIDEWDFSNVLPNIKEILSNEKELINSIDSNETLMRRKENIMISLKMLKSNDFELLNMRSNLIFYYTQIHSTTFEPLYNLLVGLLEASQVLQNVNQFVSKSTGDPDRWCCELSNSSFDIDINIDNDEHESFTHYMLILMLAAYLDSTEKSESSKDNFRSNKRSNDCLLANKLIGFFEAYSIVNDKSTTICILPAIEENRKNVELEIKRLNTNNKQPCMIIFDPIIYGDNKKEKSKINSLSDESKSKSESVEVFSPTTADGNESEMLSFIPEDNLLVSKKSTIESSSSSSSGERVELSSWKERKLLNNLTKKVPNEKLVMILKLFQTYLTYLKEANIIEDENTRQQDGIKTEIAKGISLAASIESPLHLLFTLSKSFRETSDKLSPSIIKFNCEQQQETITINSLSSKGQLKKSTSFDLESDPSREKQKLLYEECKTTTTTNKQAGAGELPKRNRSSSSASDRNTAALKNQRPSQGYITDNNNNDNNNHIRLLSNSISKLSFRKILTNLFYLILILSIRYLLVNYLERVRRDLKDQARDDFIQLKHTIFEQDFSSTDDDFSTTNFLNAERDSKSSSFIDESSSYFASATSTSTSTSTSTDFTNQQEKSNKHQHSVQDDYEQEDEIIGENDDSESKEKGSLETVGDKNENDDGNKEKKEAEETQKFLADLTNILMMKAMGVSNVNSNFNSNDNVKELLKLLMTQMANDGDSFGEDKDYDDEDVDINEEDLENLFKSFSQSSSFAEDENKIENDDRMIEGDDSDFDRDEL